MSLSVHATSPGTDGQAYFLLEWRAAVGFIDPEREIYKQMLELPHDQPVHMINLLRFRERAAYSPQDPETSNGTADVSGAEAYRRYGREAEPHFKAVGGRQVWVGKPQFMLIGPRNEAWDLAFIAAYPSGQAFIDMIRNPEYQHATRHRRAAICDSRLIRTLPIQPGERFGE